MMVGFTMKFLFYASHVSTIRLMRVQMATELVAGEVCDHARIKSLTLLQTLRNPKAVD